MYKIETATKADIPVIQKIANATWWPTYSSILSAEQLDYMLKMIYSEEALKQVMDSGNQEFILLTEKNDPEAFASFGVKLQEPSIYKLHKLYILPNNQGKGFGRALIEEVKTRISKAGVRTLDLNVNRYNPARNFYEHLGFKIIKEEDVPIGPYWMNDFVMRLEF
ncbi:GNAT family N-acetyltransferase [Chryseosolibacter indicus]|uniref:GNAT family N-acetyltransferase n=1 Tax=Chryseosolibacter indicus TaxID=2782351 RepID=A0ABS5VTV7_9BACT|nr:GNAT family N-acetyltransferase [Chryseosolibacter indicus]MBT1704860.1 GNAT family N-acetyltransferase [Chryseosolibacter indicus]